MPLRDKKSLISSSYQSVIEVSAQNCLNKITMNSVKMTKSFKSLNHRQKYVSLFPLDQVRKISIIISASFFSSLNCVADLVLV